MKSFFSLASLLLVSSAFARKTYYEYTLYRVTVANQDEHLRLQELVDHGIADPFTHRKNEADILMKTEDENLLQGLKYKIQKTGPELQAGIDAQMRAPETRHSVDWEHYNTLEEIYEFVDEIAAAFPEQVTLYDLAYTYEGRPMVLMIISILPDDGTRPMILMDSGIHAREWITPATMTYFIDQLFRDPSLGEMATYAIVPVLNPDGYNYTWTDDRYWRKTRTDWDLQCLGVDGNRNFDYMWGYVGASNFSCSDTYMGPSPLSEAEFSALADFMNFNRERIEAYITLHSYGQKVMYPWGHTTDPAPNQPELDRVAALAAAAIESVYGTEYTYGSTAEILGYLNSGTSRDYALGAVYLNYTYTFELRDEGLFGFDLPENQILDTAVETLEGIRTIIEEALGLANN